ncbi:TIGR04086 family membrane protein [Defluviitalea saccharophila]|uniref:TIGR04086 family membrane protein n=1 Tax=Defluviitalea saccharophila TaxID=879970 RepID=A0ABZ2Y802_9FIRM|nr:TIGR04086 family membrane protein [Candidatus Epulonipiscium sp.]
MVKANHKPKPKPVQTMNKTSEWRIITLLKANIIAYMITAIFFIGSALLLTYTSLPESSIPAIAIVTTIISVLVAGFDTAKGAPSKGWLWGLAAGLVYAVILIAVSSTVGKELMMTRSTATLLIMAGAGGTLGGMIGINVKK